MKGRVAIQILIIGSMYAVLYFAYTVFSLQGSLQGVFLRWTSFVFIQVSAILCGFVLHFLIGRARIYLRERSGRSIPFLITGLLTLLCILVFTVLGAVIYKYLFSPNMPLEEINELYPGFTVQILVISVFTGIVLSVVDHNLDSFRHLQEMRLTTKKLQTQQVNLRFDSLRSQISPHFLFNSLNTISSLIYRDVQIAEKFVRNLASVYQSVLRNYENPLVSLRTELELVENYSFLMQVRFEDALLVEIDLPDGLDSFLVPPLSVQMLLENAIKHNHMSQEVPLKVSITTEDNYLVVRNNFIGDPGHVKLGEDLYKTPGDSGSPGIGLENIKNRYRILINKPVLITKDENFTVSIPLINDDETEMVYR
jgi:two-component system LytT family sensor kinase